MADQTILEYDEDHDFALSVAEFKKAMFDSDIEKVRLLLVVSNALFRF